MSKLLRTCAAATLTIVLAVSAFGGTIDSPGVASPPPPPSGTSLSTSASIMTTVILTIFGLIR